MQTDKISGTHMEIYSNCKDCHAMNESGALHIWLFCKESTSIIELLQLFLLITTTDDFDLNTPNTAWMADIRGSEC